MMLAAAIIVCAQRATTSISSRRIKSGIWAFKAETKKNTDNAFYIELSKIISCAIHLEAESLASQYLLVLPSGTIFAHLPWGIKF